MNKQEVERLSEISDLLSKGKKPKEIIDIMNNKYGKKKI